VATSLVSTLPVSDAFEREYLEYHGVLPLEVREGSIVVALHGDPDLEVLKDIEVTYGAVLQPMPVERETLLSAIHQAYAGNETVVELVRDLTSEFSVVSSTDDSLTDARSQANQPPVIRFVNLLLREAHESGASDIHVEAARDGMRLRLRIDGILVELPAPPRSLQAAVVSRLKLLAELDIAERRLPQDGRIRVRLDSRELDLRVSTVASMYGESIVLRLLDRGGRPVTLDELGMSRDLLSDFQRLVSRPHGIILATGPTGSGKTTTLYAALGLRHPDAEKVITIEDPVEYHLPGVSQIPVNEKAGVRFATALRSILRQDPDVLMVGEMRDSETAGIAIQAAMTGHLVLSTVHTNDAPSALTRLVDLKVEPYMVAATVEGILAQRLVRRICGECQDRYEPEPEMIELLSGGRCRVDDRQFMRGRGCHSCRQTGYRGRAGLFELLTINEELRRQLVDTPDASRLRAAATAQGMRTLREDGWSKVLAGITTIEEVLRVVQA
jgi:general secretion pathway protein E